MRYLPAFIVDAVLVLIFAVIGRASHDEDPAGFLGTAWPFLVALLAGHALAALLPARPRRPWSLVWGLLVWVVTVAGGILLRLASGDTAEVAFIIVAALVLGAFLLGWRALAALSRRRVAARRSAERSDAAASGFVHDEQTGERGDEAIEARDHDSAEIDHADTDPADPDDEETREGHGGARGDELPSDGDSAPQREG